MAGLSTVSEFLGYCSIGCWLGAQFPQVFENIRRQSSEGLALPFLANWFLGDLSNLIGCILTHQLPFQTWLATYFVFVDFTLVGQYFYYRRAKPPPPSFGHGRYRSTSSVARRMSIDRGAPHYRTLAAAASNVAAAAALAAQDEHSDPRYHHGRWQRQSVDRFHDRSGSRLSRAADDDEVDENVLTALADSFHSERGHDSGRKRVSWSTERGRRGASIGHLQGQVLARSTVQPTQAGSTLGPDGLVEPLDRGRSLQRDADLGNEAELESVGTQRHRSRASASRRGASIVFLGAWALFGFGTFVGGQRGIVTPTSTHVGQILFGRALYTPHPTHFAFEDLPSVTPIDADAISINLEFAIPDDLPPTHDHPRPTKPSDERVIGRIFAWLCTTLYLTSRLPQIWKNFVRKSVEGLSMYLFVFAFLGNSFYVASILTSPNVSLPEPEATAFIKESIPYLLGSGGTLVFDITIVTQSFIYRSRHPNRRHGSISARSRMGEEESGLLDSDPLSQTHDASSSPERVIHPRGRGRTSSTNAT